MGLEEGCITRLGQVVMNKRNYNEIKMRLHQFWKDSAELIFIELEVYNERI